MPFSRETLLQHVQAANYRPVKPAVIAKQLGLDKAEASLLRKELRKLVKEGRLAFGPSHQVLAPKPSQATARSPIAPSDSESPSASRTSSPSSKRSKEKKREAELITGIFRRNAAGYGFVRPAGSPRSIGRDADVFIPAKYGGDAASGDTVRVRLGDKPGRMGKLEGRLVDVVQRATNRFVGSYYEEFGLGMVQIDGSLFSRPIAVGDPGAKGVQIDDKVVIEMVRFPSHISEGEGVIVEVLGPRGMPGIDTLSVIHEFGLPGEFPDDALEEARRQAAAFDAGSHDTPLGVVRQDLTSETIITIDPATARDFDDAISLSRLKNGHWLLGVHIADVSHFVQPKSALDREARDRATSVYLPDRVIPMLPEIISNHLASLQPDRVRFALTVRIEFTSEGVPIGAEALKSAIKSCRRFHYEEVDAWLHARGLTTPPPGAPHGKGAPPRPDTTPQVDQLLADMFTLAMMLRKRRTVRGALELSMPEVAIDLDPQGRVCGAHVEQNTESHQIIEEFMLAANEAVAQKLADEGLLFLRRVHASPDPRKLKALTNFVKELELVTESLESRFALQKLLKDVVGDTRQHAVNFAVLRSMQRAVYSPEQEGHYALASDCYCHFTSPIRRYPDLTIHRLIEQLLAGKPPQQQIETLFAQGDHCSDREQRAADAERELTKVKLLTYMADKIGLELDGIVTGVESFGLFVTCVEIPAEGMVSISAMTDDYYRYHREGHIIQGLRDGNSYRLGDPVRIAVAGVDVERRQLDFRLLGRRDGKGSATLRHADRASTADKSDKRSTSRSRGKSSKPKKAGKASAHKTTKGSQKPPGKKKRRR